jgi:hypothetical protein
LKKPPFREQTRIGFPIPPSANATSSQSAEIGFAHSAITATERLRAKKGHPPQQATLRF